MRSNPRKLLLDWKPYHQHTGNQYWRAEVPGLGTFLWEWLPFSFGTDVYFWNPGVEGNHPSQIFHIPPGNSGTKEDALAWIEDNLIPPFYLMLLATKENPRRSRRNPDLILDWCIYNPALSDRLYRADVPGYGRIITMAGHVDLLIGTAVKVWPVLASGEYAETPVTSYARGGFKTKEDLFRWIEENVVPPMYLMLMETAKENPHRSRHFTPSYEADSSEEYEQKVRQGKKRLLHVQIHGGRKATAGKERDIPRLQPATKTRLIERTPPWGARTQSVMAHERAVERQVASSGQEDRLEQTIRQAIDAYRKSQPAGSTGFAVPSSVEPLLHAGMPYRPADILVSRARNAFFPAIGTPVIREISRPTIGSLVVSALKAPLVVRPTDNQLVVAVPGFRQEKVIVGFYVVEPNVRGTGLAVRTSLLGSKEIQEIAQRYRESRKAAGEEYRREVHDPEVIRRLMARLSERIRPYAKRASVQAAIVTRFMGKEEVIPFPIGEHSTIEASQDVKSRIDYRSLRNVDLNSLPPLLASLSLRRKRKGRRLKVL